jgi:microcystin-dependent protein
VTAQAQIQAINAGGPVVRVLIPGFQGPTGVSAYQHAVSLGYTGSMAEWLVSLTGPQGLTGPAGTDGANFTLLEVDESDDPIFPETSVGGQGAYAAAIDTFYVCTEGGTPGTWEEAAGVAGSVFNVYNPLVNAAGPLADRDDFDAEPVGFPYLATDTQEVYVRQGAAGNWSDGIPFRGAAGNTVRSSNGPPSFLDGVDGDYNIDYANWDIYGPKTAGAWGAARSLDYPAEVAQAAAEDAQAAADAAQAAADAAQGTADVAQAASVPPSTVVYVAQSSAPAGWLKANGAQVSRTTYAALFAAVGTAFGAGDGSTTFNLPDLRGEFLRGWADGRAVDTGRAFAGFQDQAYLSHSHGVGDPGHAHGVGDPGHAHGYTRTDPTGSAPVNFGAQVGVTTTIAQPWVGTGAAGTGIWIGAAATGIWIGAAGGAETRPRNVALLAIIKF